MFVVSAQQVVDGTHYEPQCKVVQAMMTPTASPTLTPAPSVTPAPTTTCTDTDNGATDNGNNYYGWPYSCADYTTRPSFCGRWSDDDDFT